VDSPRYPLIVPFFFYFIFATLAFLSGTAVHLLFYLRHVGIFIRYSRSIPCRGNPTWKKQYLRDKSEFGNLTWKKQFLKDKYEFETVDSALIRNIISLITVSAIGGAWLKSRRQMDKLKF